MVTLRAYPLCDIINLVPHVPFWYVHLQYAFPTRSRCLHYSGSMPYLHAQYGCVVIMLHVILCVQLNTCNTILLVICFFVYRTHNIRPIVGKVRYI